MKIKIKVSMMFLAAIISLSACGKGNGEDEFKEVKQERQKLSSSDTAKESKTNKEGVAKGSSCRSKNGVTEISKTVEKIEADGVSEDDKQVDVNSDSQTASSNGSYPSSSSTKTADTANDYDVNYETKTETVDEEKHEPKPVYVTKEIPEQGHWEKVVIKEAWTEEVPAYEQQCRRISNDTGEDWTDLTEDELEDAMLAQVEAGGKGSWSGKYIDVQVGTEKIYHEAEMEEKWVVDVPAHTEEVLDHYE